MNEDIYTSGIRLLLYPYQREYPEVKSLNYSVALRNRHLLTNAQAADFLYHDGRYLLETSRNNFFVVNPQGVLYTAAQGILQGISRAEVIKIAQSQGYEVREGLVPIDSLLTASECFISSTTRQVLGVCQINGHIIGDGLPGPSTRHLRALFQQRVEQEVLL